MINRILFSHQNDPEVMKRNAVVSGGLAYTYEELCGMVDDAETYLHKIGVKACDPVVLYLPNSVDFITGFFALSGLGAISVPINKDYRYSELEHYIRFAGADCVITDEQGIKEIEKTEVSRGIKKVILEKKISQTDKDRSPGSEEKSITDKILYLFSTGSTGKPKCIARSHYNLLSLAENHTNTAGLTRDDRILMAIPLSHTYGFGNFISAISAGATIYLVDKFGRKKILDLIMDYDITVFPAVPLMLDSLSVSGSSDKSDMSSMKLVISAGSPLSEKTFYDFHAKFGIYPRQLYGSSETGVISINMADDIEAKRHSVGQPVVNVVVKVVNDNGEEVNRGEEGEIIVKSPSMAAGYENLPEETINSFRNGYYFTGDIGKIDHEGYIFITGRKKLFINISGFKVDPVELEQFLMTKHDIVEVAVKGITDKNGREVIKAFVVPAGEMSMGDIVDFCRGRISDLKIPRIIEFRDSLPKSPTGKILRSAL